MKPHIYRHNGMWAVRWYGPDGPWIDAAEKWIREVLMARRG